MSPVGKSDEWGNDAVNSSPSQQQFDLTVPTASGSEVETSFVREALTTGISAPSSEVSSSKESVSSPKTETSDDTVVAEVEDSETSEENREKFRTYWQNATKKFGVSSDGMMLKETAAKDGFVDADRNEIELWITTCIDCLPVERVLEIGAGMGRLTPTVQKICKQMTAVDFMEEYIAKNKQLHYDPVERPADEFLCRDATKLQFPEASFDFIIWNWLLMYLTDDEVLAFARNVCKWVKVGGYIFCRESCGEPSTKALARTWAPEGNPTEYRPWMYYTWLLTEYLENEGVKVEVLFKERVVSVYRDKVGTDSQRCWMIRRMK